MQHDERSGILQALGGFALLSVGDAAIKTMAGEWSPLAVAALRFSIGAVALGVLLTLREGPRGLRPANPWLQLARGICLAASALLFFCAVFVMPLAEAMAITFISPILVALLSAPLLGEKARPAVWIASAGALCGVLMVLRPNLAELGPVALLPLGSALFFALLMIANRASAGQGSALSMQAYVAAAAAPILIAIAWLGSRSGVPALAVPMPSPSVIARCLFVACTASTAHWLVYRGTMRAGASTIAPMSYVQMLLATGFGWWLFGDVPDAITVLGAGIIIAAGLYLWWTTPRAEPASLAHGQ